jgi:ABC-type antimicrobial peptide transport system permease subunit
VFFLTYLVRELCRRSARTVTALACIGVATGLVISATAVGKGVDSARSQVLNPLAAIGADLIVTRDASSSLQAGDQASGHHATAAGSHDELWVQNAEAVKTDLSQLGKPGAHFSRDFFLPGVQLTMPASSAQAVAEEAGAQNSSVALSMVATHQEGTVPKIVATFQTGGQTISIDRTIAPMTAAEVKQANACIAALPHPALPAPSGSPGSKVGIAPPTPEQMATCMPERFRRFQATIVTPQQTVKQIINPPQTDINSSSFSVLGVDTAHLPGPISPGQISAGRFFSAAPDSAAGEAVVGEAYSAHHHLTIGSQLTFNGRSVAVVGIARSVIGVQAADVYLSLPFLQQLAKQDGNINVVFLRLAKGADLDAAIRRIQAANPGMQVTSNRDLAKRVTGSVTESAFLADQGSRVLTIIVLCVTTLLVSLLSWGGVHARTRELGTLRAIGWSRSLLIRQILGESLAVSVVGAVLGVGLGLGAAAALQAWLPPLTASITSVPGSSAGFGLGDLMPVVGHSSALRIALTPDVAIVLAAMGLAIVAGMIAGAMSTLQAVRLQPSRAVQRLT